MESNPDSKISALYDGELDIHECDEAIDALISRHQESACDIWDMYALIGDQLRECPEYGVNMTASVMMRLQEEPVVLAPRNLGLSDKRQSILALAASVAGVALVGWFVFVGQSVPHIQELALIPVPSNQQVSLKVDDVTIIRHDMRDYLLAHHTQAASFRIGEGTEPVRSVAMTGRPQK